jgi:hypothetical protein
MEVYVCIGDKLMQQDAEIQYSSSTYYPIILSVTINTQLTQSHSHARAELWIFVTS